MKNSTVNQTVKVIQTPVSERCIVEPVNITDNGIVRRSCYGEIQVNNNWKNETTNGTKPGLDKNIHDKVTELLHLSNKFIFHEFYSHTGKTMWKILNVYTKYGEEKLVLCGVDEGIETAIDLAIEHISKAKANFQNK